MSIEDNIKKTGVSLFIAAIVLKVTTMVLPLFINRDIILISDYFLSNAVAYCFALAGVFIMNIGKRISILYYLLFCFALLNGYDTHIHPNHKVIASEYWFFKLDAIAWVCIGIMMRLSVLKNEFFQKTIIETAVLLTIINLVDEVIGFPSNYEWYEFVAFLFVLVSSPVIYIIRLSGGIRKTIISIFDWFRCRIIL